MTDEIVSSGDDTETSGPSENQTSIQKGHDGKVAYESFQKVLNEKKSVAERLKATESKLAEYEKRTQEAEENKLRKKGEFEKLLTEKESQLKREREEREALERAMTDGLKMQEVLNAIGGKLKHNSYMTHVDIDQVLFDPETRKVDPESVKKVADDFLKTHSHLVSFPTEKLPQTAAQGADPIDYEQWLKLPAKEMIKKMPLVKK